MSRSIGTSASSSSDTGWLEPNLESVREQFKKYEGGQITLTQDDQRGLAYICIDHADKKNGISGKVIPFPIMINVVAQDWWDGHERFCITGKMMVELSEAVAKLEQWDCGKGLILHSTGDLFCSGAFLDTVKKLSEPEDGFRMSCLMHNTVIRLKNLPMLSVAVVQGLVRIFPFFVSDRHPKIVVT